MTRDDAVMRIQDGLGFASRLTDRIILRLQETQRELEKGKTLPRFLLKERAPLAVVVGASSAPLPIDFLRLSGDDLRYLSLRNLAFVKFLHNYNYDMALKRYFSLDRGGPNVAMVHEGAIDFFHPMDKSYSFELSYYAMDDVILANIENKWLKNAPEWLIGEAGRRMAMDVRDKDAVSVFSEIAKMGRAACLGEEIAQEESVGAVYLGEGL